MSSSRSKMASSPSLLLLIALNILAISAKPVINESTSRQGESVQLPVQQGQTDDNQGISDEVRELFGDIYDDYDYQFGSPPAPLTDDELNRPPSPFFEGDYGADYNTPQFQSNFPDTESRSNSFDSTNIAPPFSAERPPVLPPTDLIHPVFDFHEGDSQPELPPFVPHPGISQFPEFARGEEISLQPGGVSSTDAYANKEATQELPIHVQNFNLPIPLEEISLQEKISSSQPSFDTNEVFTKGLSAEDAIKFIKEKERSILTASESESSRDEIDSTDVESFEEKQSAENPIFEFTSVQFPENEVKHTNEFIPESTIDFVNFEDSQGRVSNIASDFDEEAKQTLNEDKINSDGLSIEDAIKYAKLKAERESGNTFMTESEIILSENDRVIAQDEISKMILQFSGESRPTSSKPSDSEFIEMLKKSMTKRFMDEYKNNQDPIENTEYVKELGIETENTDFTPRYEIVPSIVESHQIKSTDAYDISAKSESVSEIEAKKSFDEKKVQEGLEIEEAIRYAKLKAQENLGNNDSSEKEINVSKDDVNVAYEEMFKIALNFLSDAEESESSSTTKSNELDYYTMLIDAMTTRFTDEHNTENSVSVESDAKVVVEDQLQEKNIMMAEEIINLFSQINEYEKKKALNSEEGEFVFVPSVIPGLGEQGPKIKPTSVDASTSLEEGNKKSTTSYREPKLIVEKPNIRRGYDGQLSSSVSQTESVERYYPDHQSSASSVRDQKIESQPIEHDVKEAKSETIERFYPEVQANTPSIRDYRPEAAPIPYQSNGFAVEQQPQGHILAAPYTLIQVPQSPAQPKGFFRTLAETGSVIKAGAAAFQRKFDIFRKIFKKGNREREYTDVQLAVVPAYISQVEPNAHPVEVIDYPRSSLSTSVDSSVSTSVNYKKLDGPPEGLERINEEEYKKDHFDLKESVLEKAAPLLADKLTPPSAPVRPDFDIRSHQEVSAPSQFVGLSHGPQVYGGHGNYIPVQIYSHSPEHYSEEEYSGSGTEYRGFRASDIHDTVNGVYHTVRGGYDNVRNSISRFASWFSPSSYSTSQDELSAEQVVAPLQAHQQQPLHYQPVYLAVQNPVEEEEHKTGFLGKLKKKFIPWL